ncbi:HotDog domain-containing protein [Mycena rebaudengoi]|nr:HotDog domain-containing protein [Mycena rebaudengoi]
MSSILLWGARLGLRVGPSVSKALFLANSAPWALKSLRNFDPCATKDILPYPSRFYTRPVSLRPVHVASAECDAHTEHLESQLQTLPQLKALRERADAGEWYETRPQQKLPEEVRRERLAGVLNGPGKVALFPLARVRRDESEAHVFVHVGRKMCGHEGIVHGGFLAVLLDEVMTRNAIMNLPGRVAVTATLSLTFLSPALVDQFLIITTRLVELKGRKATISAQVKDLSGTLVVESTALFIEPRYAGTMNSTFLGQLIGEGPTDVDGGERLSK